MKCVKEMQRGDHKIRYCKNIAFMKLMDNCSVLMFVSNVENIGSILSPSRKEKCSTTNNIINCPNGIKIYNDKIGEVDSMDQLKSAYELHRSSNFRFYLHLFFDLLDITCVNVFIIYEKLENDDLPLKEYKLLIAEKIIGSFASYELAFPHSRPTKQIVLMIQIQIPQATYQYSLKDKIDMLSAAKRV